MLLCAMLISSRASAASASASRPYLVHSNSRSKPLSVKSARDSLPDGRVSRCPFVSENDHFWPYPTSTRFIFFLTAVVALLAKVTAMEAEHELMRWCRREGARSAWSKRTASSACFSLP
eukprot:6197490-Pleurochrysis_carterae.AAC.2